MPQQYCILDVVVDAIRWDGDADAANTFLGDRYGVDWEYYSPAEMTIIISAAAGSPHGERMVVGVGDYVVRESGGRIRTYPVNQFLASYTLIEKDAL